MARSCWVLVATGALVLAGCAGSEGTAVGDEGGPDASVEVADVAPADATPDLPEWSSSCPDAPLLRVVVVDAWGKRLPAWTLTVTPGSAAAPETLASADWTGSPALGAAVDVRAEAEGFAPARVRFSVPTPTGLPTVEVLEPPATLLGTAASPATAPGENATWTAFPATSLGASTVGGDTCPRRTFYVGLDPLWFAAGGRAPSRNRVELYLSGETFWAAVHERLVAPWERVLESTWWWQSDFELWRPDGHLDFTEEQRRPNTMLALLETGGGAAHILINRFAEGTAGGMAYLNSDTEIRAHGEDPASPIEVMLQGNPTPVPVQGTYDARVPPPDLGPRVAANAEFAGEVFDGAEGLASALEDDHLEAASFHQKVVTVDGDVAFIAGMNVKSTDWDTEEHAVFEPRRMKFQSTSDERHRVQQKLQRPDLGPRKDYGVRIEGPAATDTEDVLRVRWDLGLATAAMLSENASAFALRPRPDPWDDGVALQVVPTLPPPIAEQSILATWQKALARAEHYIYIEDQYFRMPLLDEVIQAAMEARPELTLIVVTKPVSATDGGKKYTVQADHRYRDRFPDRYLMLQLRSFDAVPRPEPPAEGDESASFYFDDMDTHSKILIVDDAYLSVGSCNKNNRGVLYEGELNVAAYDPAWVREQRARIYRNVLGPRLAGQVSDDPLANFVLIRDTAAANAAVYEWWQANGEGLTADQVGQAALDHAPDGFAYPLTFTDDYALEVGPDAF